MLVRARVRKDLDALKPLIPGLRVSVTHDADYPYRALVTRKEWARALERLTAELDYDNFKDAVKKRQGDQRASMYLRVWSVLQGLTPRRVRYKQLRALYDGTGRHYGIGESVR